MTDKKNLRAIGALKSTANGDWEGNLYPTTRDPLAVVFKPTRKRWWTVHDPATGEQIGFLALSTKKPHRDYKTGEMVMPTKDRWNGVILDVSVFASVPESQDRMVVKQRMGREVVPFMPWTKNRR